MDIEERRKAGEEFRKFREVLPPYMCVYAAAGSPLYANDGVDSGDIVEPETK